MAGVSQPPRPALHLYSTGDTEMKRGDLCPAEMPVLLIPVDVIKVPADRLRSLKDDQARAIGAAIVADGQYDPITVAQLPGEEGFLLVDGLHRLEGCRAVGIHLIEARIGSNDRDARLRHEVLSGIARATHDVFDKAAQVGAIVKIVRKQAGIPEGDLRQFNGARTRSAIIEQSEVDFFTLTKSLDWSATAAEQLDLSAASVRRYAAVAAAFDADDIDLLRKKSLADELGPLLALSRLPPDDFQRALLAIARSEVATITDALALSRLAPVSTFDKRKRKLLNQVKDWEPHEVRELIAELRDIYRAAVVGDVE